MNPYALIVLIAGILLIVMGWKGSQDNVVAAVLGHPYGNSTLS